MEIDFVDYQTECIPLDVTLVLFGVIAEQYTIFVYLYENRADFEGDVL